MKAICGQTFVSPFPQRIAAGKMLSATLFVWVYCLHVSAAHADMVSPRTTAREVRLLNPLEAAEKEPVVLTGVVTALSGWKNSFFLQDETSGISINRSTTLPELKPGDRVVMRGVTGEGAFAPMARADSIQIIGHSPLPERRLVRMADMEWGAQDSQWVAVQGEVRSVERKPVWGRNVLLLNLSIGGLDSITVFVHDSDLADHADLVGANVTVQGVCGTIFNDRRQFSGLRLFANSLKDIHVDKAAPADPYDFPYREIDGLLQFSQSAGGRGQVKIQGTVTWARKNIGFYLQQNSRGAFVQDRTAQADLGTEVVAIGYPALDHASPTLHATRWRAIRKTEPLLPIERNAHDMIVAESGFVIAPYDSVLVKLTGKLLEYVPGMFEDTLILESNYIVFRAKLPVGQSHKDWKPGSVLSLRGVCVVNADEMHEDKSFDLQLQSAADVVELHAASWWTAAHALWLSATLGVVVLLMLAWVTFLRRQASLRLLADTDALTGLHNRRGFLLLAQKQVDLTRRHGGSFLLFYIDVNRFKQINDEHGHRAGDAALKDVSALLRSAFRECDIIGRLGGDEFAVMAIATGSNGKKMLGDRIATALHELNQNTRVPYQLSLSLGTLFCDERHMAQPIEDLLAQADVLMYENKRSQRMRKKSVMAH